MNYVPIIIFVLVIAGLIVFSGRARRRQAATRAEIADRIDVGTDVMSTSGLHGTVVVKNDDDTVQLSIAPGVEVRWELAALRDVAALPKEFRSSRPESDDKTRGVDLEKGDSSRGADPL